MSKSELRAAAKDYVAKAVAQSGKRPSQAKINQAVAQVVKAFEPIVAKKRMLGER
jgi:hypothetical protein